MKSVEWHSRKYRMKQWLLKAIPWKTKRMIRILKHYGLVTEDGNIIIFNGIRCPIDAVLVRQTYGTAYIVMNTVVTNLENDRRV